MWTFGSANWEAASSDFCRCAICDWHLPLGTAYAIWTGIGAVGAFVLGIIVLGEAATPMRIGSALLIVAGMVGLKLASDA